MAMPDIDGPAFASLCEAMVRAALGADRTAVDAARNSLLEGCYASKRPALELAMSQLELEVRTGRFKLELDELLEQRKHEEERQRAELERKEQRRETQVAGIRASLDARRAAQQEQAGERAPEPTRTARPADPAKPTAGPRAGSQNNLFTEN